MKISIGIILILAGFATPAPAFANGVFKCTDDEGTTTFSFTPCAASQPESTPDEEPQTTVSRKTELERLDASISRIQRELEDVKRDYEDALSSYAGQQSSDELTHKFDSDTMRLISELNTLQSERKRAARL